VVLRCHIFRNFLSVAIYLTLHNTWVWCNFPAPFQEWEEEAYPPYANGPGYVISSDIAQYIVSEFDNQTLRVSHCHSLSVNIRIFLLFCLEPNKRVWPNWLLQLFKMEDVSMGMWVEKFNRTRRRVVYSHDFRFYQSGCFDGYYTAHYQSPQHMICLWRKLQSGSAQCCNARWQWTGKKQLWPFGEWSSKVSGLDLEALLLPGPL
jgi:hypothetical protein